MLIHHAARAARPVHHTLLGPTISGCIVMICAVGLWYLALLLDDIAISAAAVCLTCICLLSTIIAIIQLFLVARVETHHGWWRWIMPGRVSRTTQYEQLDQNNVVIARFVGTLPRQRGWYRCSSIVYRWHDPFALVTVRALRFDTGNIAMLPEAGKRHESAESVDRRSQGSQHTPDGSGIREYAPGDPPKYIAWRPTAHRGTLMTREANRERQALCLIVLEPAQEGHHSNAHIDRQIQAVMPIVDEKFAAGKPVIVTDGEHIAKRQRDIVTLLASLCVPCHEANRDAVKASSSNAIRAAEKTSGKVIDTSVLNVPRSRSEAAVIAQRMASAPISTTSGNATIEQSSMQAANADAVEPTMKRLSQTVSRIIRASHNPVHVVIAPLDDRHGGDPHYLNRHNAYPHNPGQRGADHHRAAPHINDSHTSGQTNHEVENSPLISMMRRLRTVDQWTIALSPNEPGEQTRYREVIIGRPIREACATAGFPGDDVSNVSNTDNASSTDNGDGSNVGSGVDTGNAVDIDNEDQQKLPGPSVSSSSQSLRLVILSQVIRCAATLTFLLISIQSLTKLIAPSGHWVWFALTASVLIAIEGNIATKRRIVSCLRALGMAALLVIAAWMYCRVELDLLNAGQVGKALARSSKHGMTSAQGGSHGSISIPTLLHRGFTAVYEQLPPVQVGLASDAFLVAIIALTLVIVRLVLLSRHGFVVLSVLPISVLAVDFMILGLEPAWWQLALIVMLFAASLWARNPMWSGTATALCSSILVAVLVMAMTPSAVALANRVPISIGNSVGLLSSNTINPMVDLKRSLTQGSGATVLTYMSEQPRYLRLTTLDDFNGDMWSYDKELARDGNLYGGGIALNSPEGSGSSLSGRSSNTLGVDNLVGIYMMYMMLGSFDLPNSTYYGEAGPLKDYYAGARIHIDTLNTRFLPAVGSTMNFDGVSSSWHHADDGTIYSRDHTTIPGMEYTISGTYMEPIHADGGFQQLSDISAIRKSLFLEVHNDPLPWRQRTELRHEYVRAGLAGEHDGWMFVTMTLHADGTVTDGDGDQIGTTADAQGSATSADGKNAVLYKIQFNDAFCSRTGFNVNDEPYAVSFDTDNSATLAMAMDTSAFAAMDDDGEPEGAGILDSNWANDLNEIFANINKNGIATITSLPSSQGIALPKRLIKRIADKQQQIHRDFTVLPERLPSQITAVRDKAHQSGVASTPKTSDEQIAAMKYLVDYFTSPSNAFTYSLDAPDGDGRSNMQIINDFLETKTGYCVHYAGALAILGRSLGIPTRMVLGYNSGTGKINASGRYQVAAKQLHSWTEAYIDDIGWVPFDVTPASTDNGTKADSDFDQTSSDTSEQHTQQPSANTSTPESGKSDNQGDADNTDEAGNPKADNMPQETGNAAPDSTPFVWWRRAVAITLILMALALLLSVPWGLRRRQRKRRLRYIERAALEEETARERNAEADVIATSGSATVGRKTDLFERSVPQKSNNTITDAHSADRYAEEYRRAWISAWSELCDTAWDMGVRWNAADTDRTIAERIAAMGAGHASRRGVGGDMELHDAAVSQDGTALQGDTAPHGGITLSARHQALIFGICEQAELVVFSEDPTQSRTHLPARQVPQGRLKLTELNQRIAGLLDAIRNADRQTHPIRTRLRLIFPSSLRRP